MRIFTHFTYVLSMAFALLWSSVAWAQDKTITGTVTSDAEGELPGVNVLVKGTSTGTVTDLDGNYRLAVPEGNDILVFSSIGYANQEITIGNQTTINVVMAEDVQSLQEIVVVGYGTQEKKEITSAVTSVSSEEFNKGNVNAPYQLLQGKVAGLVVSRPGANPNEGFSVRLRGLSTLGANSEPLVIIDGVVGADLNAVDPNDIESMDILKDGSAAAIYGSRGSSGVILVTTKTGKSGQATIDYNGYVASENTARVTQVMSAEEFRNLRGADGNMIGTDLGANTDWFDELTQNAISHVHNVALSGGSEQTTYRVSLNYRDIEGVARATGFEQLNARLNLTQRALNDRLSFTINLSATTRDAVGIYGDDSPLDAAFRYATITNPTQPIFSDDPAFDTYGGYYQQTLFDYFNPVGIIEQTDLDSKDNNLLYNFQAEYEPLDGLRFLARYSQQRDNRTGGQYFSKFAFFQGRDRNGLAGRVEDTDITDLFETTATYDRDFGNLTFAGLAGYSYQNFDEEGFGALGGNFLTDAFGYNNLSAALDFPNGLGDVFSYRTNYKIIGFFGRVNLNYAGTYFLSASVRREGSTRFGDGNKWGNFPAVSAGVTLSNLFNMPSVDNLKLRVSYGVTGNTPGESYVSLLRLAPQGNFFFNGSFIPSYGPASNPNPNLRWERKAELDIGVDFAMFGDRFTGSADYYSRVTTDLIYPLTVPVPPNLVGETLLNVGQMNNSGLELVLNYNVINNDNFSWTTGFNGTWFIENRLVSLSDEEAGLDFGGRRLISNLGSPGQNNTPLIEVKEGEEIGRIWGKVYDGLTEDGKWRFQDLNGDGTIDDADETLLGQGLPDFQLGWNNTFNYGNWDLNFFLRGMIGHDLVNTFRAFYEVPGVATSYNVVNTEFFDPNLDDSPLFNSIHVEDADFIRLDNATLGYNFPLADGVLISRLRLYASVQNLFTITNYTGVDPEVRTGDSANDDDALAPGIDRRDTWFTTRTYTFGVNLSF
ncbi:MAG: SusC/RagA family TonB-linked outer membrane protein [Cyclobacteriaceae bacterium]